MNPPLRNDQQPHFAATVPTQLYTSCSVLKLAVTRAESESGLCIFTQPARNYSLTWPNAENILTTDPIGRIKSLRTHHELENNCLRHIQIIESMTIHSGSPLCTDSHTVHTDQLYQSFLQD